MGILNNIKIEYYDTLPSTNSFLKTRAKEEDEGLVVVANSQTEGHGRFGRKFYSPENSGIYMSILLKPEPQGFNSAFITATAALAVSKAIENLSGKETDIKWVNDILMGGKKVCGILAEGSVGSTGLLEYVILGIGINAFLPEKGFHKDIKDIAGFVFDENKPDLKEKLTTEVITEFFTLYQNNNHTEILDEYRKRSAVLGKEILVLKGEKKIPAKALLIDDNFHLKVEYQDKSVEFLNSGEISIKI